ncbi:AGE family epimerase/isomerase [Demequina activiva]|uniref:Cellobiose 2-epimerase n=1 Tax=Demequina activiva TaxID=1582364 RepID=A0A919Q5X3_9MICO|nr:AGE family epimerase/isomerase [Demequina activiva]GIG55118.1 cellobiose 2-epimerase [Demequina activiva]
MPAPIAAAGALADLRERAQRELTGNILPFWEQRAFDAHGWLAGTVRDDLSVDADAPRHSVLAARILWTFAEAARADAGAQRERWLAVGATALDVLTGAFWDAEHGGVVWSLDAQRRPLSDRKQVYAQAFAIYGLAAWSRAARDPEALARAMTLFELLERHARDTEGGGYLEAHARDWGELEDMALSSKDLNVPKSMNTNLHVMEAFTTLLDVSGDRVVGEALAAVLDAVLSHILRHEPWVHCALFFDRGWTSQVDTISFGHDIEASWLLWEAYEALERAGLASPELESRTRGAALALADAVRDHGVDSDGGVMYEGDPTGVTAAEKHWWPQAEGVVGWLNAFQIAGRDADLVSAVHAWEFLDAHIVDHAAGEWWAQVDRDRRPMVEHESSCRIGPWKCPYHNGRACLEVMRRIQA